MNFNKTFFSALIISVGLISFQSFIGVDAILFYSEIIFRKAGNQIDSSIATIIIGIVMLISSFITLFFVDSVGRKCLLMISAAGMFISLILIGAYFYLDEEEINISGFKCLPVISLIGFITFYCLGFGPLPFTILSEMFSPEVKSTAVSFAVCVGWLGSFVVTKAFLPLESIIHIYGNFWLFSGFCAIALIFTATFVFETKGLTMNQIQLELNKNYLILR
jgi:MFS family permease